MLCHTGGPYLKTALLPLRVDFAVHCLDGVRGELLHLGHDVLHEVALDVVGVHVLLEVRVSQLVARLILSVVVCPFLDGVVGQVDQSVGCVLQVEFSTGSPDVALVVEVGLHVSVLCRQQSVSSNVELSVLVQQRLFDVLLNNVRSLFAIDICVFAKVLNVVEVF